MKHWKRNLIIVASVTCVAFLEYGLFIVTNQIKLDPFINANMIIGSMLAIAVLVWSIPTLAVDWRDL